MAEVSGCIFQIKSDSLDAVDHFVAALGSPYENPAIESIQTAASLLGSATSVASYLTEESAVRNYFVDLLLISFHF